MARWTPRPTVSWPWCTSWEKGRRRWMRRTPSRLPAARPRCVGREVQVGVEVEVQRRVDVDGHEAGPARGFPGLGAAAIPLSAEPEAGGDADDGPAPISEMEEGARAADRLVVGEHGERAVRAVPRAARRARRRNPLRCRGRRTSRRPHLSIRAGRGPWRRGSPGARGSSRRAPGSQQPSDLGGDPARRPPSGGPSPATRRRRRIRPGEAAPRPFPPGR